MNSSQAYITDIIAAILGLVLVVFSFIQLANYKSLLQDFKNGIVTGKTGFHRLPVFSRWIRFAGLLSFGCIGLFLHHHIFPGPALVITTIFISMVGIGLVGSILPGFLGRLFQSTGYDPDYAGTPWVSALAQPVIFLFAGTYLAIQGWSNLIPSLAVQ